MNRPVAIVCALSILSFPFHSSRASDLIPSTHELIANGRGSCEGKEAFSISLPRAQPAWGVRLNELERHKRSKRNWAIAGYVIGLGATGGSTYYIVANADDFTYTDADFMIASTFLVASLLMNYVATKHLRASREYRDEMASYEESVIEDFNREHLTAEMRESLGKLVDFGYTEAGNVDRLSFRSPQGVLTDFSYNEVSAKFESEESCIVFRPEE